MNEGIIEAMIAGGCSLLVAIITAAVSIKVVAKKFETRVEVFMAVQNTKIEELTREVREHNGFARRMPVVESEIKHIKDDINKYHSN